MLGHTERMPASVWSSSPVFIIFFVLIVCYMTSDRKISPFNVASLSLHLSVFIIVLLVTHLRPSELLALIKKGLVSPRVPDLPWLSVVIEVSESRVPTKARVRNGSVGKD